MHKTIPLRRATDICRIAIIFIVAIILSGCARYEVPTPFNWSEGVKITKSSVSEAQTVEDWKAMSTLFTYYEFPMAQPLLVQSIDGDRWITVFEKPSANRSNSKVMVERVNENEYRLVIIPAE